MLDTDVRLLDVATALVALLGGWMIREVMRRLEVLEQRQDAQFKNIMDYRASLPEKYVSKADHDKQLDAIFELLRRIEAKLDGKADK